MRWHIRIFRWCAAITTTAKLIWASKGKDEDYMFGYSEEELEDAL